MPRITFIDAAGVSRTVDAEAGISLMQTARNNDIPGIVAECGGMCACATCHVFIEDAYFAHVGPAGDNEEPLLEFVDDRQPNSRLACQIELTDQLDGMIVHTPESQG